MLMIKKIRSKRQLKRSKRNSLISQVRNRTKVKVGDRPHGQSSLLKNCKQLMSMLKTSLNKF